jgi:hypothetical protein
MTVISTAPHWDGLNNEVYRALRTSSYWTEKTKEVGKYIERLTCPECGEPEAYAHRDNPFAMICNRQNNCGAITKTIPLLNITANFEERCKPTQRDKHRPAREFLRLRGLPDALLKKTSFKYFDKTRKGCGGGVFFKVGKVWSGRLFNPPQGEGKTHTTAALDGQFWQLDAKEYSKDKPLYITEGIINALSLFALGQQAVALVAAATDPAKFDLAKLQRLGSELVLAFDGDTAGAEYTKRWTTYLKEKEAQFSTILPRKGDWNDLLTDGKTTAQATEYFAKNYPRYKTEADLALAETAQEYAQIYAAANKGHAPGLFAFNGCYYWSWIKRYKHDDDQLFVKKSSNFNLKVRHYQISEKEHDLPVFTYRLDIKTRTAVKPVTVTATGNDLKSPDAMTGFFLRHAKANWNGGPEATNALREIILETKAPDVRQAEFTGYDHQSRFHILKDIAVSPKGEVIKLEKDGYFNIGQGQCLRPCLDAVTIRPEPQSPEFIKDELYPLLCRTWGNQAAVAVSFLTASIFVNQVKPELGFFPFLSLHGDPQTGKSRLLRTLNAMQGLDEEGLPMNSANTKKSELRTIAQVSGIMKGMIEGNDKSKARFDFESILPLYNYGNPIQTRAAFSNDNQVIKMLFHGTLAFAQNREPFESRAAKERVISLKFSTDELNEETKAAYDTVCGLPVPKLAGFLLAVLKERQFFENNWRSYHEQAKKDLMQTVPDNRINENHAVLLAFHRLLCEKFGISHDLLAYFEEISSKKIAACQQRTLTPADLFFEKLNELPEEIEKEDGTVLNLKDVFWEVKDDQLYINLPQAEAAIRRSGLTLDQPERLLNSLQEHQAFIRSGKNHRFPGAKHKPVKAFVFDIARLEDEPLQPLQAATTAATENI